jgi:hypothetical protein
MSGPRDFIRDYGEVFDIRRGDGSTQAQGLKQSKARKHVQFLDSADVRVGDILYGTVSRNEFRVTEIERQDYRRFGIIINAYYENLNRAPEPAAPTSVNTINVGTMTNSALQQASPGAQQILSLDTEHRVTAQEIVAELLEKIHELGLDGKQEQEVVAEAETVKAQLKLEKPKSFIIKECLNGIKGTLQSAMKAGGTDLGPWFIKRIEDVLSCWQS